MKKFGDMSTSELDKLLVKYVMSGESFLSDKELEATKEIEKSNERFIQLMKDEQAHRKLEKLLKDKPQHIPEPVVGPNERRVILGGETDPLHLNRDKSVFSSPTVRTHVGGLAIRETTEGFLISNPSRSIELPPVSLKGLREFCKFVLQST